MSLHFAFAIGPHQAAEPLTSTTPMPQTSHLCHLPSVLLVFSKREGMQNVLYSSECSLQRMNKEYRVKCILSKTHPLLFTAIFQAVRDIAEQLNGGSETHIDRGFSSNGKYYSDGQQKSQENSFTGNRFQHKIMQHYCISLYNCASMLCSGKRGEGGVKSVHLMWPLRHLVM